MPCGKDCMIATADSVLRMLPRIFHDLTCFTEDYTQLCSTNHEESWTHDKLSAGHLALSLNQELFWALMSNVSNMQPRWRGNLIQLLFRTSSDSMLARFGCRDCSSRAEVSGKLVTKQVISKKTITERGRFKIALTDETFFALLSHQAFTSLLREALYLLSDWVPCLEAFPAATVTIAVSLIANT